MQFIMLKILSLVRAFLTATTSEARIDTHIHALPQVYLDAVSRAGGDPSGFPTPEWSIEETLRSMDRVGTSHAILSISTPGVPILGTTPQARILARDINHYFGNTTLSSTRLGFFAALPDWRDVDGTLAEIDYLYISQRLCHGVSMSSSYGNKLPGDAMFTPIWKRLNEYHALVFLHPTGMEGLPVVGGLSQAIIDFPLATTRAAVDIVFTKTFSTAPNINIILSHAGGTLPFLANRALGSLLMPSSTNSNITAAQARKDFGRFHLDLALSTSAAQLNGVLDFTGVDRVLWGSDFPFAPGVAVDGGVLQLATFVAADRRGGQIKQERLRRNAVGLLQRHEMGNKLDFGGM